MTGALAAFFALSDQDRRDVFAAAANRLDTLPSYVEKDFWVCVVLDVLFNRLPDEHPKLFFKGGTSLSKGFGLISRFSEDVDLVVHRDGLGFGGERDPTVATSLSNKARKRLTEGLKAACSRYVLEDLAPALHRLISSDNEKCAIAPDEADAGRQTLLAEYRTLYPGDDAAYVSPRVKIEAGARSALDPISDCIVTPYVADQLPGWALSVGRVRAVAPERTYWEKLLILHGVHCGYRDQGRLPADRDRISRHYYDVAMITATDTGRDALSRIDLLDTVRDHNLLMFRQAWKRFEEAVPGTLKLVPQPELRKVIDRDYSAMEGMVLGDAPEFGWVMEQLASAETAVNAS